jgi:Rrf2 family protein
MLCITKKTEYALVALAHLAEQPDRVASAREIAVGRDLPLPLLMNILKNLQSHGVLRSTRGVKGGYQIDRDLNALSLYELVAIVDCGGTSPEGDCGCMEHAQAVASELDLARVARSQGPVQALQFTLVRFLKNIRLADVVLPGRRIDVPVERLQIKESQKLNRSISHAHHAE